MNAYKAKPAARLRRNGRPGRIERAYRKYGILFALPWLLGLLIFYAYPLFSSVYYSFTQYNLMSDPRWIGLRNYAELFKDPLFRKSVTNTLYYTLMVVPFSILFGVLLSLLLNVPVKGQGIFRTIIFLPTLVPAVAASTVWQWLLNPQFGIVNYLLGLMGIPGPSWFFDPGMAKQSLVIIAQWTIGNSVLIYLAGLQDISKDYYEAASLDGANTLKKTFHITLPLLTPVIFFNMVMGIINALQVFALPFSISGKLGGPGSPANSLMFYSIYIYKQAFSYTNMGYASAMAWILFVIIMVCTLLVFKSSNSWVYYEDEG